jgi:HCOMODA/2-hydroxy-3-carboxy-muconic semialdehyde decarboxylase
MTDLLVRNAALGSALAASLGDKPAVLMRGHGATVVGKSLKEAVYRAIYATQNAELQARALAIGNVTFLEDEEARKFEEFNARGYERPWQLWKAKALKQI